MNKEVTQGELIYYSHDLGVIDETIRAMRSAMKMVRKYWEHPLDALEGQVAKETFRLVCEKEK